MIKDYKSFLQESLQGVRLTIKVGNYIDSVDPEANFWFQETIHLKEYEKFLKDAKDCDEKDIPALVEKAKELKLFQTVPSNVWDISRIENSEKVRTDKDCYLWMKAYIITMLNLFIKWSENK